MINVNTFKPGTTFKVNHDVFLVIESNHAQQARGQANVKVKMKNLRTGAITMTTYTGGDKVDEAIIERRGMNLLYLDNQDLVFMDEETFEQKNLPLRRFPSAKNFLREGTKVIALVLESEVLDIEMPANVTLKVTEAPDAVRGNSSTAPSKRIKVETGYELDAPMFIKQDEEIIVATETGKYVGRA